MARLKFEQLLLSALAIALLVFFQNCGEISYVSAKGSAASSSGELSTLPLSDGTTPASPGGTSASIVSYLVGLMGDIRYDTARTGDFSYTLSGFPPNTNLSVSFHFAEILGATLGDRTFDIAINGAFVRRSFDITAAAGGSFLPVALDFNFVTDANGSAVFRFASVKGSALLSGFQVSAP